MNFKIKRNKAAEPKYLFRGTTKNFAGGRVCQEYSYTCTSTNPIIALLFAMECALEHPDDAVIYIAKSEKVADFKAECNVLKKIEREYVVGIKPCDFITHAEGYVEIDDFKSLIEKRGIDTSEIVRKEKLTELCKRVQDMSISEIDLLWQELEPLIKKY